MAGNGSVQVSLILSRADYEQIAVDAGLTAEAFNHWWNTPELREPMSKLVIEATARTNEAATEALKPIVLAEVSALKGQVAKEFERHRQAIALGRFANQLQSWASQIYDQNKYALKQAGINSAAEFFEQAARIKFNLVKPSEVECDCSDKCECDCRGCGCCQ